jgi:probable rRNA maturation factor
MAGMGVARATTAADPRLQVYIERAEGRRGVPTNAEFAGWSLAALRGARALRGACELALRVVGSAEMQGMNAHYRGRDYATNVLSFPADAPPGVPLARRPLGDIVLCTEVVLREAGEQGKAARAHWAHMTVHGVLHLLGHDHVRDDEAAVMEALERRILGRLGIADPYA